MIEFLESLIASIKAYIRTLKKDEDERETPDANYTGALKIGLIVGHTKKRPGASFYLGGSEYQFNDTVAKKAKTYCEKAYGSNITLEVIYRDRVGIKGAYKKATDLKCDLVVELHFNAFNKSVKGTETLTTTHSGDKAFGLAIQQMMCRVFKRDGLSRGLKPISRSSRGGGNVYAFQGYNCLVEPFFGDNPTEARLAKENMDSYAKGLVDASVDFGAGYLGVLNENVRMNFKG